MANPQSYELLSAFEVFETTDERGSLGGSVGVFRSQSMAESAAEGKGWYGGRGRVKPVALLWVHETGECFKLADPVPVDLDGCFEAERARLRAEALKKLTNAERSALGL
jgi:hypothetical protein